MFPAGHEVRNGESFLFKISWMKSWFVGLLLGAALFLIDGKLIAALDLPAVGNGFVTVFLKNFLASLSTIYLGWALCHIELKIYTGVSRDTYAFMERLTEPLYKLLGAWHGAFPELKPFYRSCLFYLLFVPNLSLLLNGVLPGFLLLHQPRLLLPHGVLEIPLMLASAKMAFSIKEELEGAIIEADLGQLKESLRRGMRVEKIRKIVLIQLGLLFAAYVEVNFAF